MNLHKKDFMTNDYKIIQNPNEKWVVKKLVFDILIFAFQFANASFTPFLI